MNCADDTIELPEGIDHESVVHAANMYKRSVHNHYGGWRSYLPKNNPETGKYWKAFIGICVSAKKMGIDIDVYIDAQIRMMFSWNFNPLPTIAQGDKAIERLYKWSPDLVVKFPETLDESIQRSVDTIVYSMTALGMDLESSIRKNMGLLANEIKAAYSEITDQRPDLYTRKIAMLRKDINLMVDIRIRFESALKERLVKNA